jgi:formiminotetrahydrofolate cyclodeaminase
MVAALSADRPRYADHAATHATVGARGRELVDRFLTLADRDSDAYGGFAAALKLPKETDADRLTRSAALAAAARVASEVPMACVEACLELVEAADMLAGRSNVNAASDLGVASLLAEAAAQGAAANVLVNLPSVGDDAFAADMSARVEHLLAEVSSTARRIREVVASGEARAPLPTSNT